MSVETDIAAIKNKIDALNKWVGGHWIIIGTVGGVVAGILIGHYL